MSTGPVAKNRLGAVYILASKLPRIRYSSSRFKQLPDTISEATYRSQFLWLSFIYQLGDGPGQVLPQLVFAGVAAEHPVPLVSLASMGNRATLS